MKSPLQLRNFNEVLEILEALKACDLSVQGRWDPHQHLMHCAQAINYSINGYPIQNSWLKQNTIGKLAFNVFNIRGYMRHDTNELTPGAPVIPPAETTIGLTELKQAIHRFDQWQDPLHPHQFYGKLSKMGHEKAHVMHIANHLEMFDLPLKY